MCSNFVPRPYQVDAVKTAVEWIKKTTEPGLIEAYTAAGKSFIIAEIARIVSEMSGKKVLVLQPNKELLEQNAEKYRLTGEHCSLFSASANSKSLRHNVVFGTALTIKNYLERFGDKFCLVILDEADASLTPTILDIIKHLREQNPKLRILGLTSSPYKTGTGYIYKLDINDNPMPEDKAIDPFFTKQIVHISGRSLLEQGYVSPIIVPSINVSYDTSELELNSMGKFTKESIDQAFIGKGRKTSEIIRDLVRQTQEQNRISGLIFAATQQHCEEIYESLPPSLTAIVTDKTTKRDRERIVKDHRDLKTKYLINVGIFTRGTDFPRLDFVALLRATESSQLLHQILGRLARIHPDKKDGAVFDYSNNIDNHHPDGDLFNPVIKTWNQSKSEAYVKAICELCKTENTFTARKNEDNLKWDEYGYYVDLDGNRIQSEYGAMPAHYGRRCLGLHLQRNGKYEQCGYRWTFKNCPECDAENDIAARYCSECKAEIIDPNTKLIADFRAMKRDPYHIQCDKVLSWNKIKTLSKSGNEVLKVEYTTEYRSFTVWYQIKSGNAFFIKQYEKFLIATQGGDIMPESITYKKNAKTGFFEVLSYNQEVDKLEVA